MCGLLPGSTHCCLIPFCRSLQMVPVLNCIGVHAAAVGNHDCECATCAAPAAAARRATLLLRRLLFCVPHAAVDQPLPLC